MAKFPLLCLMILGASTHAYSINNALDQNLGPVQFVSIWYRHGERAPIMSYPGFEVTYPNHWPRGLGELTTRGLRSHYQLGQWLRNKYNHLIPTEGHLSFDTISVVSSDLHRCVQSAQANLAGMFPPSVEDSWGPLNWMPIPMTTQPDDVFSIPHQDCLTWSQEFNEVMNSADYAAALKKYSSVITESQNIFNMTWGITDPLQLAAFLWSALPVNNLETLPMTEAERNFYRSLDEPNFMYAKFEMHTESMRRLGGHPMIQWVINDLKNARHNLSQELTATSPMKRFSIYSAKDNTLIGILNSLNVTVSSSPVPTSILLFELRQAPNGTTYVTLLFRNVHDFNETPTLLEVPGCSYPCTLTQFLNVTQGLIPNNWEEECKSTLK